MDTTTRAVAVSSAVTVRREQSATKTPVTAPPVNPGGISHCARNVNPFIFLCFVFIHPPSTPPPPDTPISTTSRLAANIDSMSELSATCMMCRASPAPVHAGTTYPFLCQINPLSDLSHPTFKLFLSLLCFPVSRS